MDNRSSFSAVNGSYVFIHSKITIQSIGYSTRGYRNTRSTSFTHAQKGVIIGKEKLRGPAVHIIFS